MTYFVQAHEKCDGRTLWLYSRAPRSYTFTEDLPPLPPSTPSRRWHELRGEWVYYNAARNNRTFNPPAEYNPLAPVQPGAFPGEIPVTDFEVAVFDNRFPGLKLDMLDAGDGAGNAGDAGGTGNENAGGTGNKTEGGGPLPATGHCEVVVYSTQDHGSLADFSDDHVALLLDAWGHRVDQLQARGAIAYVLPFENRGAEIGTTLPHPHGQIYAFGHIPPIIERQARNQAETQAIQRQLDQPKSHVAAHGHVRTLVPQFARYPFETWIISPELGPSPSAWQSTKLDMAKALKAAIRRLDTLFDCPMPLVMWVATAPRGFAETWPCHIQIYPFLRGPGRLKYLASVEQMTGLMLSDVLPETAVETLRNLDIT